MGVPPKDYINSTKRYSVLYMRRSEFIWFKTSYTGEWNIDEKLDSINAELIVIGIEHGNDRTNGRANTFKNDKYGGGNADAYLEFIVKTLKPQIKSKELRQKKNINYG
jgi:alpha-glucosidase